MKKLLLIVAMLWGVSYAHSQSKIYIRGDSIVIQKVGGNSNLIIENSTRNVTGGVLTNIGNGRTAFVAPSAGAGFDSTANIQIAYKPAIGNVLNHSWGDAVSTSFTSSLSTITLTPSAGKTTVGGTGGVNTSNSISETFDVVSENHFAIDTFIMTAKSGTSHGFAIVYPATTGNGQSFAIHYMMSDTAGYMSYSGADAAFTLGTINSRLSKLIWNAGDTFVSIQGRLSRNGWAEIKNISNGSHARIDIPGIYPTTGKRITYFYSPGIEFIGHRRMVYNDIYQPDLAWVGMSFTYGANAETEREAYKILGSEGVLNGVFFSTGPSEGTSNGLLRLPHLLSKVKPQKVIVWEYMYNDYLSGTQANLDSSAARTRRAFQMITDSLPSTMVIAPNMVPRGLNVTAWNDSLQAICTDFGYQYVDVYSKLVTPAGNTLNTNYIHADGTHENSLGQYVHAGPIIEKLVQYLTYGSSVTLPVLPFASNDIFYDVKQDQYGKLYKAYPGESGKYLRGQAALSNMSSPQNFNGYAKNLWISESSQVDGGNPNTSPLWSVNKGGNGLMTAVSWSMGNGKFTGTPSIMQLDVNAFRFTTGAYLNPLNQTMEVRSQGLGSGVGFDINNVAATVSNSYILQRWRVNDSVKSFIDRYGWLNFNGETSGTVTLKTAAAAGTWSLTLPTNDGTSGQVLSTDGNGVTSWATAGGGSGTDNANVGAGYRLVVPSTQEIKTLFPGTGITIDSTTNTDGITITSTATTSTPGGNNRDIQFNDAGVFGGTDSIEWAGGQLSVPNHHISNSQGRFGDFELQTYSLNNSWLGTGYYDGGFKRRLNGSYFPMLYFNTGDILFQTTTGTGSAGSAATHLNPLTIKKEGKVGFNGITAPVAWTHLTPSTTGGASLRVPDGVAPTTPASGDIWAISSVLKLYTTATRRFVITNDAAPSNGQIPIGNGTDYTAANVTSTSGSITVTNGAGTIDLSIPATKLADNTWVPTLTAGANVTAVTNAIGHYTRNGNEVSFTLYVQLTATAGGSACIFDASLPIASNFTGQFDALATGTVIFAGSNEVAQTFANATDDRLTVTTGTIGSTSSRDLIISGHYTIK